jgi:hypothetical protein
MTSVDPNMTVLDRPTRRNWPATDANSRVIAYGIYSDLSFLDHHKRLSTLSRVESRRASGATAIFLPTGYIGASLLFKPQARCASRDHCGLRRLGAMLRRLCRRPCNVPLPFGRVRRIRERRACPRWTAAHAGSGNGFYICPGCRSPDSIVEFRLPQQVLRGFRRFTGQEATDGIRCSTWHGHHRRTSNRSEEGV